MEKTEQIDSLSKKQIFYSDDLLERFKSIREQSLSLCGDLEVEDMVVQPGVHISPPKWHLAHTTWFFEEMILAAFKKDYKKFDPSYSLLFNSYYKSIGAHWLQGERGHLSRPTVKQVNSYREYVDQQVISLFNGWAPSDPLFRQKIEVGIQHEQQHQELLLMDIKAILANNPLQPSYSSAQLPCPESTTAPLWKSFREGIFEVGKLGSDFSFDNEGPRHKVYLYPFAISDCYVTNSEFLDFMKVRGYEKPEYWLSEGWDWVQKNKVQGPHYWQKKAEQWWEYTLHGAQPLMLEAPVAHISYFEADAYAKWKGVRLPSEQESEIYLNSQSSPEGIARNEKYFHSLSARKKTEELWWWTRSQYSPYPRFKGFDGQLSEYNGKFMCNQFVLKGGCFATPCGHHRNSYRNFYPPEQRWMFSGLRLAKDV